MTARRFAFAAVLFASSLFAACGGGDSSSPEDLASARKSAGTVNGLCPVLEQTVNDGVSVDYKGQKIGFCCGTCKKPFLQDPEKYMAKMRAEPKKFGFQP